jgi:hypothetical protein
MIQISTDEQTKRINAILTAFPDKVQEVYKKAIKAGQAAADKESFKAVMQTYAITRANLNDKNSTRKRMKFVADRGIMTGEIRYSGYKLPLYRFSVSPRVPSRDNNNKIRVPINGRWITFGKSKPVQARQFISGNNAIWKTGFIAQMNSGHIGVFTRKNYADPESPIEEKLGSSVAEMVGNTVILEIIEMSSYEAIVSEADKQIQRILAGG